MKLKSFLFGELISVVRAMEMKSFLEFVEEKEQSTIEDVCEYIFLLLLMYGVK